MGLDVLLTHVLQEFTHLGRRRLIAFLVVAAARAVLVVLLFV